MKPFNHDLLTVSEIQFILTEMVEKKEQYFNSMEQLIKKAEIHNVSFEEIWKESELNILY